MWDPLYLVKKLKRTYFFFLSIMDRSESNKYTTHVSVLSKKHFYSPFVTLLAQFAYKNPMSVQGETIQCWCDTKSCHYFNFRSSEEVF